MGVDLMIFAVAMGCLALAVIAYFTAAEMQDAWEVGHHRRPRRHTIRMPWSH